MTSAISVLQQYDYINEIKNFISTKLGTWKIAKIKSSSTNEAVAALIFIPNEESPEYKEYVKVTKKKQNFIRRYLLWFKKIPNPPITRGVGTEVLNYIVEYLKEEVQKGTESIVLCYTCNSKVPQFEKGYSVRKVPELSQYDRTEQLGAIRSEYCIIAYKKKKQTSSFSTQQNSVLKSLFSRQESSSIIRSLNKGVVEKL